ncbi:MAG: class I SAM-dependent methyltransferase [Bacteroidota bacterium]
MSTSLVDVSLNVDNARRAFSAQAPYFDSYEKTNVILRWMRRQVYNHLEEFLSPGDNIFELNAGTGIDAVYFAARGHLVFAIDNAEGMLLELEKKIESFHLQEKIQFECCSFTELQTLPENRFNHVFSNFGGLNCVADLRIVTNQLPRFLKTGAMVTFVIMPRVCPWELLHLATGSSTFAVRRFSKKGTTASIEGHKFLTYYFSPGDVIRSFNDHFRLVKLRGLASISPPPYMAEFAVSHPRLYRMLSVLDERYSTFFPFNRWADHFIITFQYVS